MRSKRNLRKSVARASTLEYQPNGPTRYENVQSGEEPGNPDAGGSYVLSESKRDTRESKFTDESAQ
jgi:hypothetical protein